MSGGGLPQRPHNNETPNAINTRTEKQNKIYTRAPANVFNRLIIFDFVLPGIPLLDTPCGGSYHTTIPLWKKKDNLSL